MESSKQAKLAFCPLRYAFRDFQLKIWDKNKLWGQISRKGVSEDVHLDLNSAHAWIPAWQQFETDFSLHSKQLLSPQTFRVDVKACFTNMSIYDTIWAPHLNSGTFKPVNNARRLAHTCIDVAFPQIPFLWWFKQLQCLPPSCPPGQSVTISRR